VVFHGALLGLSSTAAGPGVRVRDHFGLADVLGAHLTPIPTNRIGHQKPMPPAYLEATLPLADPGGPARLADPAALAAARRLLDCPAVRELRAATGGPLTLGRLVRNVLAAPALTRLRIPHDPQTVTSCDQLR
jgi:arabinofuranosyltransferase